MTSALLVVAATSRAAQTDQALLAVLAADLRGEDRRQEARIGELGGSVSRFLREGIEPYSQLR